jgi:hypothetical protein
MQTAIILVEWLATFFLAVEAIKLENLSALRVRLHRGVRWINPEIRIVDGDVPPSQDASTMILIFFAVITSFGAFIIFIALRFFDLWPIIFGYIAALSTYAKIAVYGVIALFALPICMLIGGLPLFGLERLMRLIISGLVAVERNTASGVIGITGFLLFSIASTTKLAAGH